MTKTSMGAGTIVGALERRARDGDDTALWLETLDGDGGELSCTELLELARSTGAALAARGVSRGDHVVIVLPTGRDFVASFYGTLVAGGVGVPLYPPAAPHQVDGFLASLRRVVRLTRPAALVTFPGLDELIRGDAEVAATTEIVVAGEFVGLGAPQDAPEPPRPEDIALIQFSSGSTSEPRGIALSHGNIVSNIEAFQASIGIGPPDRCVSWLPLYHDMGLIGTLLGTVVTRIPLALFSPLDFLRKPAFWLEVLSRREATIGVAPQFAYNLCLAKVTDDQLEGLDLSPVRVLLNGAEPVDVEVVRRFEERFAVAGLRPGVITPCYGLAECALAVTMSMPLEEVPVRRLDRETGEVVHEHAVAGDAALRTMLVASAGPPVPGAEVAILGPDGEPLADEQVGEIAVRSSSVCQGQLEDDGLVRLVDERGWLRTGDLGFRSDGDIYPVDRRKDIVIVQGRNLYPQDIEREAGRVPGTLRGRVAAFGVSNPELGTEGIVIAAEVRQADERELARRAAQIRTRVVRGFGVQPLDVVLLEKGSLPLTSSGKIRRHRIRHAYGDDGLPGTVYALRAALGAARPEPREAIA